MEENMENKDGLRVTRARTRRQSVLDTDSRPTTPQLDLAADRGTASPRPLRRARLNSTTTELRTPTRTTRRSVARGETPEPITPSASASLRSARTPAKSARKQLPLQEEDEDPVLIKEEPKSSPLQLESEDKHTPVPTKEKRVTRSMSKTPPIAAVKPQLSQKTPKEKDEQHVSNRENNVSPSLVNLESKTVEIESETEKPTMPGTTKLVVKLKEISQTILTNSITTTNKELLQNDKENVSIVIPMEVDEIDTPENDVNTSSAKSETIPIHKSNESETLEKSLKESKSSNSLETTSEPEIAQAPAVHKPELVTVDLNLETNKNVLKEDIKSPNKKMNVSIEEISDTEHDEKTPKEIEKSPKPTKETSIAITHEEEETVEKQSVELDLVVIESDSSFKSVEASPKSEAKAPIGKEKESDAEKSFESMETASAKDQPEVTEVESEENNNNNVEENDGASIKHRSVDVISDLRLPDLSPGLQQRMFTGSDQKDELKKSVVFTSDQEDDKSCSKRKFPKTPSRDKPPLSSATIKSFMEKERDTPLKTVVVKVRHSSTPIQKVEEISLTKSITNSSSCSSSLTAQPPLQIDSIKPLVMPVEVETKSKSSSSSVVPRRLVSDNEDENETEDEENICLFVDNEVEVADDNYQSGDSMDSSERREIKENEIPCDGESVGSQDTVESSSDDESGENDSFIVSDNDVDEDDVENVDDDDEDEDEDEDDIEPLCWEDDTADTAKDSKKQRRRIIVVDSSDEDEIKNVDEPEIIDLDKTNRMNTSNASKLSEAAMMLNDSLNDGHEDDMVVDPELESSRKMILHDISKPDCLNKTSSRLEISTIDVNTTVEESSNSEPEAESNPVEVKPSTSSTKADDEEALLAELASGDLTHLQKMFNPLQKARRQSLYLPSPEMMVNKEPKLKRRSDRMLNDFNPSQSFMEMVAEQQRQLPKRQRLSKSFCGAPDDDILEQTEQLQIVMDSKNKTEQKQTDDEPKNNTNADEEMPIASSKDEAPAKETETKTKSIDHYMKYCDEMIQAANEAKLEQKKQEIAARGDVAKKRKKLLQKVEPDDVAPISESPECVSSPTEISGCAKKNKKKLKRLVPDKKHAIQRAVNRAIELLVPDRIKREPQSLARKLSPQPTVASASASASANANANAKDKDKVQVRAKNKTKKPLEKKKKQQQPVSPIKSSDEENHNHQRPIERIRTNAGYVTVYKDDSPQRPVIELIKTKSGIMRVEPATPTPKYFEELPAAPRIRKPFFREEPVDQKKKFKQKSAAGSGSSTESAQRFKARVFSRKL